MQTFLTPVIRANAARYGIDPAAVESTRLNAANVCTNVILAPLFQGNTIPAGYSISGTGAKAQIYESVP